MFDMNAAMKDELEEEQSAIRLEHLFKFECDITEGRNISGMDLNSVNPDLLAVSYGEFDMDSKVKKAGILAFWTLKNPSFAEKIIHTEFSLTCCQFSKRNPNLIAVGDSHGNLIIYDVKREDGVPVAQSNEREGKHTDIIWEIKWVDRKEKGETIVTIAGDGRVIEWSMKKGLELNELMQLKRQANPHSKD